MGFKALGLETFPVEDLEEARQILRDITREEEQYAIIYDDVIVTTEPWA